MSPVSSVISLSAQGAGVECVSCIFSNQSERSGSMCVNVPVGSQKNIFRSIFSLAIGNLSCNLYCSCMFTVGN